MADKFKINPITGKMDIVGEGGGGGSFNPSGTYPTLTAGNLAAKESDAVRDELLRQ